MASVTSTVNANSTGVGISRNSTSVSPSVYRVMPGVDTVPEYLDFLKVPPWYQSESTPQIPDDTLKNSSNDDKSKK
ncbi:hypothetical protein [Ruminococcus flavefaciens]|uniref:hypothetical protein n=1 Tax=Ruminococcus flavefaciens TaxID=1265 RepID=UPI0012D2A682|nr:hypothetical protein [Ruminococcus flavefaciens]